jgi:hypothetical protein
VLWRKFQIQPYVSHDPPDALLWLEDRDLPGLAAFVVEVTTKRGDDAFPRLAVTLHGEGRDDGLSGHTFVVRPGADGVEVRLEEYDRLVYWGVADVPKANEHVLRFARRGRRLSCVVDGRPLLADVDLPPLPKAGIGLMTWDSQTGVSKIRVERVK